MSVSEQIIAREFAIARKGYDRDEVREFLEGVAAEVTALEADLERTRADASDREVEPEPTPTHDDDDFARLGSRVAAVLQSAERHASEITDEARTDAAEIRRLADDYDTATRGEADDYSRRVRADADAYAEMVAAEAENRALERVGGLLEEAAEARRLAEAARDAVGDRLRTAAEDVRLTLEAFEASTPSGSDSGAVAETVLDEARHAASVFSTGPETLQNGDTANTSGDLTGTLGVHR